MAEATTKKELEDGNPVRRWIAELDAYDKASKNWTEDAKATIDAYTRAKRSKTESVYEPTTFNIFWSSLQIQMPAVFARAPQAAIDRRWKDKDTVARVSAMVLERACSTELEFDDIKHVLDRVSFDYQVVGRGVPWLRYDRTEGDVLKEEYFVTAEADGHVHEVDPTTMQQSPAGAGPHVHEYDPATQAWLEAHGHTHSESGQPPFTPAERPMTGEDGEPLKEVLSERAPVEYVHWKDFAHKPVKSWEELRQSGWVARKVAMTRDAGVKRFGEDFKRVPLNQTPDNMDDTGADKDVVNTLKKALVYEIWNAEDNKVYWVAKDFTEKCLDIKDDPFGLADFFPCPRPVLTSLTNEGLIPVPDYKQYEDLVCEIDEQTERIHILTKALKVKGIYDASMENLASLLSDDAAENTMFPVENLATYLAKGSTTELQGVVQFLPIKTIAEVLVHLYESRAQTKMLLDEVSGVSDILRGNVDPREKLGQSRIKGQFATLRLSAKQDEMARIARDTIRLKAELVAEHFSDGTIREISGFDQIPDVLKLPEGQRDQLFAAVMQLLRSDKTRGYKIDIETDSTVNLDEAEAKEQRIEFLTAIGTFLGKAVPLAQQVPQLTPVIGQLIMFAVRGFKAGRTVEGQIEEALEQLAEEAKQPKPPPPDPKLIDVQQKGKLGAMEIQRKARKDRMDHEVDVAEVMLDAQGQVVDQAMRQEQADADNAFREAEAETENDFREREMAMESDGEPRNDLARALAPQEDDVNRQDVELIVQLITHQSRGLAEVTQQMQGTLQAIHQTLAVLAQPKEILVHRDAEGRVLGGQAVPATVQ